MRLTNPKKLAEEERFLETAKAYYEKALRERDVHKRRRFLNFAGRFYESAGEFSLSAKCFLESGDLDRTLESAVKSGNPKVLSSTLAETGHSKEETLELLLRCSLQLLEARENNGARAFAGEAHNVGPSPLTDAMISLVDGVIENNSEKVASCAKATRFQSERDILAREINFVANKFLVSMPKVAREAKEVPDQCPECGAPLPPKRKGKIVECEYCGFPVRLE
jgi:hypothetical protein